MTRRAKEEAVPAAGDLRVKPTAVLVPPRGSTESLFTYGMEGLGYSPGPMTLVSSFFSDQGSCSFFPQPVVSPQEKDTEIEKSSSYKRSRPTGLVVAPTPTTADSLSQFLMTPSGLLRSPGLLSPLQSPFAISHRQALAYVTAQASFSDSCTQEQAEAQSSPDDAFATVSAGNSTHKTEPETLKIQSPDGSQPDEGGLGTRRNHGSDGYNWRKYGEKNVKGSEGMRSYYRCSYTNCPVRKKVERSLGGSVSEIIYKGQHNHDPPKSTKCGRDHNSTSMASISNGESCGQHTAPGVREGSVIVQGEEDEGIPAAKRRSMEHEHPAPVPAQKTSTEYKIVVQTRSEVDLLDDGYRWRKYGQKTVKGKTHPRSYYKCTYDGCTVRKQVERASSDSKDVITTYEGKHNHEIPVGKYSSHANPHLLKAQSTAIQNPTRTTESDSTGIHQRPATLYLK